MKRFCALKPILLALLLVLCTLLAACNTPSQPLPTDVTAPPTTTPSVTLPSDGETEIPALSAPSFDLSSIPAFDGKPYAAVNGNIPFFTESQLTRKSYEYYSALDALGRCGTTVACIGRDLMPTEDRESISHVYPSGWVQASYDIVDGKYLYNRAHLIGFQLTGENDNEQNLITGTRYFNVNGMLTFENMVADYIKETGNHVLYRVTPIFVGDELVARGVLMEGWSIEDGGDGICFNVFVYNAQPGITIDYATGKSALAGEDPTPPTTDGGETTDYILNKSSGTFHKPTCSSVSKMKEENKQSITATREEMIEDGYSPCGTCKP